MLRILCVSAFAPAVFAEPAKTLTKPEKEFIKSQSPKDRKVLQAKQSSGSDDKIPETTVTLTTTLPTNADDLLPEQRYGIVKWFPSMPNVHLSDGGRFAGVCRTCDVKMIRQMTRSKEEAEKAGERYWGFHVNREFGEVDHRENTCLFEIAKGWSSFRKYQLDYPEEAKLEPIDYMGQCPEAIRVLSKAKRFDVDHLVGGAINVMDLAMLEDHIELAEVLIETGEHKGPRDGPGHFTCASKCMQWLAPDEYHRNMVEKHHKEKRTSLNSWSYDTAKRFYSEMDQARRWCKFFSKKHLTCPLFERTNFPNVHGSQYPLDYQWGAAKMREMLEITPAKGDKELLESDFKKWDYRDYPLAGVASAEEEAAAIAAHEKAIKEAEEKAAAEKAAAEKAWQEKYAQKEEDKEDEKDESESTEDKRAAVTAPKVQSLPTVVKTGKGLLI